MQTSVPQDGPPDMEAEWKRWIQEHQRTVYQDLLQLHTSIFVDVDGNIYLGYDKGTTNYVKISPDGVITLHGSARIYRHITLPAVLSGSPASAPTEGNLGNYSVLTYTNVGGNREAFFNWHVPTDWAEGTDISIHVHWAPTDGNAGNVKWDVTCSSLASEANAVLTDAGTTLSAMDATQLLQDELLESPDMTLSGSGLSLEDTVGLRVERDVVDAADTYASPVNFVILEIKYLADKLGDAA